MMDSQIHFCPHCGTKTQVQYLFGVDRATCPACGWVHFDDPKVAAAVLVVQQGQVLLTRRMNEPFQGMWTLPAGFVNANEDPAEAALRECREETGLQVRIASLFDLISGREHDRGADILIIYRGEVVGGTLRAGDDADEAKFFSLDNLPPLAFTSMPRVIEKYVVETGTDPHNR